MRTTLPIALLVLLAACGGGTAPSGTGDSSHAPEFDFAPDGPLSDEELGDFHVALTLELDGEELGTSTFELWPEASPHAVRRFLRHCAEGTYDDTPIHRVMREFVLQAGDPTGSGRVTSPYGELEPEPTVEEAYRHGYGVMSMTMPPSQQFFVCLAESPKVWALDEKPVSRLGRMTSGVAALEQAANAPVAFGPRGEKSRPRGDLRLARVEVRRGPPPRVEDVRRPAPDLQGQPEVVAVQHVLVTFTERAPHREINRNRLEAAARARECLERIRSGELEWEEAVRAYTDEPLGRDQPIPVRRISNFGVLRLEAQRAELDAERELRFYRVELRDLLAQGVISPEELALRQAERTAELAEHVRSTAMERREDVNETAYTEVAFGLEVGEVGLVEYDPYGSPPGWYVVRRIE